MNFHQMKHYIAKVTGLPIPEIHDSMTDMLMYLCDDCGTERLSFYGPKGSIKVQIAATPSGDVWSVI